jgi:voltage-gated potassium channel
MDLPLSREAPVEHERHPFLHHRGWHEVPAWRRQAFESFSRVVEWPLLVLAGVMIPTIVIPLIADLPHDIASALDAVDYFIWGVFILEYAVKVVLAPRRWDFVKHDPLDLVIIAVPLLRPLRLLRAARELRLLRLTRLGAFAGKEATGARRALHVQGLMYVGVVTASLVFVTSLVVYDLERTARHATIKSWPDSLWWAVSTVSSIGARGLEPVTAGGRTVATLLMFAGIGLVSVLTAALATFFVARLREGTVAAPDGSGLEARIETVLERLTSLEARLGQVLADPQPSGG